MFSRVFRKKSLSLGTLAGILLSTFGFAIPVYANGTIPVTSFNATPTTIRSGDYFDFKVNGTQNPNSAVDTFVGCYVYWVNEVPTTVPVNGAISLPTSTFFHVNFPNYDATNDTYRFAGWAGQNCAGLNLSSTPSWQSDLLTVTPQLEINTVNLTAGQPITGASFPYSDKSSTGSSTSPFDWSRGGEFSLDTANTCGLSTNELPAGVTLDTSTSANGVAPSLVLDGTPEEGTEGTYQSCVRIRANVAPGSGIYLGISNAIMRIVVSAPTPEPSLPKTGISSAMTIGITSALLLTIGGALLLVRRKPI